MIKINLLNSVTDRQNDTVNAVERKVSNPNLRLWLIGFAVAALFFVAVGYDVFSTRVAKAAAETELENKKQVAAQLESVMKEQKELEIKIENIKARIEAIKALRASQAGPSAVLNALTERIASTPGVYLISVEQKGDVLTIKGTSPDEKQVTDFGRSLEFSSGLFSNLNIETQLNEISASTAADSSASAPKLSTVNFTIRCAYTPSKASSDAGSTTAAVAQPAATSPAAAPAQVAQK